MAATPRLLAIDNDAHSAELVARFAERCGYEAFPTSDSRGVINLVAALKPDVITLDIAMSHLDAVDLFRLLVAQQYAGEIIIISGEAETTLAIVQKAGEALGLRRPKIHQKPLDFTKLRDTLNDMAKRQGR